MIVYAFRKKQSKSGGLLLILALRRKIYIPTKVIYFGVDTMEERRDEFRGVRRLDEMGLWELLEKITDKMGPSVVALIHIKREKKDTLDVMFLDIYPSKAGKAESPRLGNI